MLECPYQIGRLLGDAVEVDMLVPRRDEQAGRRVRRKGEGRDGVVRGLRRLELRCCELGGASVSGGSQQSRDELTAEKCHFLPGAMLGWACEKAGALCVVFCSRQRGVRDRRDYTEYH